MCSCITTISFVAISLLLIILASLSVDAGPSSQLGDQFLVDLLLRSSRLHGRVEKHGMLPAERWDKQLFNEALFQTWLKQQVTAAWLAQRTHMSHKRTGKLETHAKGQLRTQHGPTEATDTNTAGSRAAVDPQRMLHLPAPMSYRCLITVNHAYRFLFIRNRKAASTTLQQAFNKLCDHGANQALLDAGQLAVSHPHVPISQMWANYTVFSTTRNPWARAASAYDYCTARWKRRDGACSAPTFMDFTASPLLVGLTGLLFQCNLWQRSHMKDDTWQYDFYHAQPIAGCMQTGEGLPAVDFLVRYEQLEADVGELVALLNSRKDPHLPPIRLELGWQKRSASNGAGASTTTSPNANDDNSLVGNAARKRRVVLGTDHPITLPMITPMQQLQTMFAHANARHKEQGGSIGQLQARGLSARQLQQQQQPQNTAAIKSAPKEIAASTATRHAEKYGACGWQCVWNVAMQYQDDFDFFGFELPDHPAL